MERLLPKDNYFKHTTRNQLSEAEKEETIDAIDRASQYLGYMSSINRMECSSNVNGRTVMRSMHNCMAYFSRWVSLIKGGTQPRRLYRRRRRYQVELEARKMAKMKPVRSIQRFEILSFN